jgi:hypothetical protein
MAISYVGGVQGGRAGNTGTTTQSLSGTLSGGSNTSPSAGDLVVVLCAAGADTTAAPTQSVSGNNNGAYTQLTAQSQLGTTYDSYHLVSYIIQGSTVDTTITIPSSGSARNAQRWIVHVFRGVDSTTPMDVTATYAKGTATGRPNPAAITPTTAGAWIAAFYASAAATGAAYTAPTDFATDWLGGTTVDTADCMTGGGYYTGWVSGNYDPAAISAGGTTNADDSWTATTVALRPALPALTQAAFRFYADGTENGSSALQAQDTNHTADVSGGDVNFQLRARLQETGGTAGDSTDDYQLQYELNDSGMYFGVGTGICDNYTDITAPTTVTLGSADGDRNRMGQTFAADGKMLVGAEFYLHKSGTPTGNITADLYAITGTYGSTDVPTGAVLATSDTIDISTLSTSASWVSFTFSGANIVALTASHYAIVVNTTGISTSSGLVFNYDASSPSHGGRRVIYNGSWSGNTASDAPFSVTTTSKEVVPFNSASLTDGNATTNRLGSGTGSFVAGEISEDGLIDDLQITASNYTELLYSLTIDSDAVADNDTLDFRVLRNGSTTGMTYTVTPRITIEETAGTTIITQDVSISTSVDTTTITQDHIIVGADIAISTTADNATISQNHVISNNDIAISLTEDTATVAETHILPANDTTVSTTIDSTIISQNHVLAPDDIAFTTTTDNDTINQNHVIVTQDVTVGTSTDNTTVSQNHVLVGQDILINTTTDNGTITQNHIVVTQDSSISTTIDGATIAQNHVLATQDIALSTTTDNSTVEEQANNLITADVALSTSIDATTISQNHVLTPDDIAFNTTTDNVTIAQNHIIVTQDTTISTTLDNASINQAHIIATNDLALSTSVDATTINQNHVLATNDITISTTTDNTTIDLSVLLEVGDLSVSTSLDSTSIAQNHVLSVDDILFTTSTDNDTISQNHVIATNDVSLSLTTDNATIIQIHNLSPNDTSLSTLIDSTIIQQTNFLLSPNDISITTTIDQVTFPEYVEARKYYIDSDGNIYWVINQDIGLVEQV